MRTSKSYAMLLLAAWTAGGQIAGAQTEKTKPLDFPTVKDADADRPEALPARPVANKLFYFPTRDEPSNPAEWGHPYRKVEIISGDGTHLSGWWIEPKVTPSRGTVVFSHGNAGSMGHHLGFVMWLARAGYEVLIYDYRGYGKSEGSTDRLGMVRDTRAALTYAGNQRRKGDQKVISYGHSLGGAKSIAAIAEGKTPNLRAVVSDAAFASYREMALIVGGRLAADLVSDDLSPIDQIEKISPLPLLLIHGKKDPVVPFAQGQKLFDAAKKPKTMFKVDDGSHGDSLWRDEGAYRKLMLEWLEDTLKG